MSEFAIARFGDLPHLVIAGCTVWVSYWAVRVLKGIERK
jgi:hypothetical protein